MIYFFLIFLLINTTLFSEEILVVTESWESYSSADNGGYYIDVLNEVFKDSDYTVKLDYIPFARSVKLVENGMADIVLGVYKSDIKNAIFTDSAIELEAVDLFILKENSNTINSLSDLTNKTITAKLGYCFDKVIKNDFNYVEKTNRDIMLKMLKTKRVDAILDYELQMKPHLNKLHFNNDIICKKSIFTKDVFFAFSNDNKKLKKYFDKKFLNLYISGELKTIMLKNLSNLDRYPFNLD